MSAYENYHSTSGTYDLTRIPIGTEIIVGCLAHGPRPLAQQRVLDAGCGTGNYAAALLDHVDHVAAVDLNTQMLDVARTKLGNALADGRIEFHCGSITELPFADASFDGVMVNQVLHHLADDRHEGFPLHRRVVAEFARVLKPGGGLVVNTCSMDQLRQGFWYYALIPEEARAMRERHVPIEDLEHMLVQSGLRARGRFVPLDAVLQGEAYFDPHGPLDRAWRNGDSIWSTVPPERLREVEARIRLLDECGELQPFVSEHDTARQRLGQMTFVFAQRNAEAGEAQRTG